jgi:hypothetical protein
LTEALDAETGGDIHGCRSGTSGTEGCGHRKGSGPSGSGDCSWAKSSANGGGIRGGSSSATSTTHHRPKESATSEGTKARQDTCLDVTCLSVPAKARAKSSATQRPDAAQHASTAEGATKSAENQWKNHVLLQYIFPLCGILA